ncbi:MAG: MoaD/ThiS family protein [Caldilineaceae bacterium]
MELNVRLNGTLAQQMGRSRLRVTLADGATVDDLLAHLQRQSPLKILESAVPFVAGQHVERATPLQNGQEVALLIPIAGGR